MVDGSVLAHAIPERERHAEEPLAADAPVAGEPVDPVLEPRLHVRRVPAELAAAGQQRLARVHRLDEPLPAGHDLQRTVALLVELHGVRDRTGLAEEVAALAEKLDRSRAGLGRGQPGELIVVLLRARGIGRRPAPSPHVTGLNVPFAWMTARTGRPSSRHQTTSVMSPNVQIIATPVPFSGSASVCARSGTRAPKSGVTTSVPKSG